MSKRKNLQLAVENSSGDEQQTSDEEYDNCVLPRSENSDVERCTDNEESDEDQISSSNISYNTLSKQYTSKQKKLEENHIFSWVEGEKVHATETLENRILLSDNMKNSIRQKTHLELFELFFTKEIKQYIIDATAEKISNFQCKI